MIIVMTGQFCCSIDHQNNFFELGFPKSTKPFILSVLTLWKWIRCHFWDSGI